MRALPAEEKAKIAKLNEGLRMEKNRLVTEVSKWDDQSNEIIVLAKKMCMIMMDMSDFTRFVIFNGELHFYPSIRTLEMYGMCD